MATQMSTPSLATTSVATESECAPSDTNIGWEAYTYIVVHSTSEHILFPSL